MVGECVGVPVSVSVPDQRGRAGHQGRRVDGQAVGEVHAVRRRRDAEASRLRILASQGRRQGADGVMIDNLVRWARSAVGVISTVVAPAALSADARPIVTAPT